MLLELAEADRVERLGRVLALRPPGDALIRLRRVGIALLVEERLPQPVGGHGTEGLLAEQLGREELLVLGRRIVLARASALPFRSGRPARRRAVRTESRSETGAGRYERKRGSQRQVSMEITDHIRPPSSRSERVRF